MDTRRLAMGLGAPIATLLLAATANAQTFRSGVEDAARQCDAGRIAILQPLSKAEKDIAVVRSWTSFGRAFETEQKALAAMQGKAMWIGPTSAEGGAQQALEQAKKCQATFEAAVGSGGNVNLALFAPETAGDANALGYLLSKGANPAARDPDQNKATYGMLALKELARFDFAGRQQALNSYLDVLIPRMGQLKGLKDANGLPIVYYALGLDPLVRLSSNQATVDVIIRRIAAAGADVASPWKQAYVREPDRAFRHYNGSDPEVAALLRGDR